jgi:hypothetical protein
VRTQDSCDVSEFVGLDSGQHLVRPRRDDVDRLGTLIVGGASG